MLLRSASYFLSFYFVFFKLIEIGNSELLTVSCLLGSAAVSWYNWETLKENTYCRFAECCNSYYVPYDLDSFKLSLHQKMFGQPLVNELFHILSAQKKAINEESKRNRKALVISLHGWAGVGKNYAATMIADALYHKGMNSKYVKIFHGKTDFDCSNLEHSKRMLIQNINEIVKKCPKSLIILDEIHDMCPSVLDTLKPMLDYHHAVDGVDYRDTIFILISNIGGKEIAEILLELYSEGKKRNEVEFHNFEPVIRRTAYYTGGFEKSSAVAQHLIDYYIPFLPLEQQHVEQCVLAEFRDHGIFQPTEKMLEEALLVVTYGPTSDQPIFANNGCKRFSRHIPYIVQKYKNKQNEL